MRRREFITLVGGAAAAWPHAARAQQSTRLIRLGFLGPTLNNPPAIAQYQAFDTQLEELGFREGQNLIIDYQVLDDPRGPFVVAAELMRSQPDLIVAIGPEASLQAVVGASGFIPVVMIAVNFDPLARGYIPSLARPSGNITGLVFQQLELAQKQVELLTQAFPDRTRLAVFFDAQSADQFGAAERAAKALNLQVQTLRLENPPYDFDAAFHRAASGVGSPMSRAQPYSSRAASVIGAAYGRDELIASHGAGYPLPSLLNKLAKPGCTRLSNQWDHCGAHYVEPIDRPK